ncbi:MAG: energy transducer TonB [Candidatus Krumholzibacteriia bacterium]
MSTDQRVMTAAVAFSLLAHALLLLFTWDLSLSAALAPVPDDQRDEIELLLVPDEPADRESELPRRYTAVPERLATDEPPENPDFLALHHSRAADSREGGRDTRSPSADREAEVPQIAVQRERLEEAGGVQVAQPDVQEGRRAPAGAAGRERRDRREGDETSGAGEWMLPSEREQSAAGRSRRGEDEGDAPVEEPAWMTGGRPSILRDGTEGAPGDRGFEFDHLESGKVGGNVAVQGAFSLNTYEWDFAPWMHRFEQDLHRAWRAPYAYALGVISGKTVIRLVVERDGRPSSMEVVETDGHESLHQASASALQAFAPYAPLPPNFPEPQLVITLSLHYPAWAR